MIGDFLCEKGYCVSFENFVMRYFKGNIIFIKK